MIKKTWKKALAGLCAAAMVMTSISWPTMSVNAQVITPADEWAECNRREVKLTVKYGGDEGAVAIGSHTSGKVSEAGDWKHVFDGDMDTGINLRKTLNDWGGHLQAGDYIQVDFKEPADLANIKFAFTNDNNTFGKSSVLEYTTDGDSWKLLKRFTVDNVVTADYTGKLEGVTAVRLVNGTDKGNVFVNLREISFVNFASIDTAPIAYYSFDNITDTTTLVDECGNHNGTISESATIVDGKLGKALSVNEAAMGAIVTDYDTYDDKNWSVAYWVKTTSEFDKEISVLEDADKKYSLSLKMAKNGVDGFSTDRSSGFRVGDGNGDVLTNSYNFEKDTWYHIAWTQDKTSAGYTMYVNGVKANDTNAWTKNNAIKAPLEVIGGTGFTGLIDEVRVYDYVLSAEQVFNLASKEHAQLEKFNSAVLNNNAKANSWSNNGNDGPASWAFDNNETTLWHSNWGSVTDENKDGQLTKTNPLWIQTGFDKVWAVKEVLYSGRGDNNIKNYILEVAFLDDPLADPDEKDWKEVASGETGLGETAGTYKIVLDDYVHATHIRLKATSTYTKHNSYIAAREISIWGKDAEITDVPIIRLDAPVVKGKATEAVTTVKRNGIGDVSENPVQVLGNIRTVEDDSIDSTVYQGTFTVEGGQKLDRTGDQTLAISFKYKRNTTAGKDLVILNKFKEGSDSEYTLVFTNPDDEDAILANNLQLWGKTEGWSQHDMKLSDEFWGNWHDITICFTKNKYEVFVDGVVIKDSRPNRIQILQDRNLPFVFNPSNDTESFFADFKMYTDLNSDFNVNQQTSYEELKGVLAESTKLFEIGEEVVSKEFTTSTTWTNVDGTLAESFDIGKSYVATITLTSNKEYGFAKEAMPKEMIFDGEKVAIQPKLSADGKTMTIEYTCSPFERLLHTDEVGTFVYASDLPYTKQQNHDYGFTVDKNIAGDKISLYNGTDGTSFDKGFMCHAPGSVSFEFAKGDFVAFSSYYGVDYTSQYDVMADKNCAMVDVSVLVNDKTVMKAKDVHVSSVMPHTGLINLKEANSLKVDFAAGTKDWNDHSVLADAKFYTSVFAEFTEATASLKGTIGLNFYVQVNDSEKLDDLSVTLTRTKAHEGAEKEEVTCYFTDDNKVTDATDKYYGQYKFTFNVAAKEMTDVVTATLMNGNTEIKTVSTSVKGYAETLKTRSSDAELKKLLDAMLCYGAAAQKEFGYNLNNLASDADLATALADITTVAVNDNATVERGISKDVVNVSKVSLLLKDNTVLRVYLKAGEGVDISAAYDMNQKFNAEGSYMEIDNISAKKLDDMQTFTITQKNVAEGETPAVTTVVYSPLHYAKAIVEGGSTDTNLVNVAKALYNYHVCAEAYLGE